MKNNSSDLHEGTKARRHESTKARKHECRDERLSPECRGESLSPEIHPLWRMRNVLN
ncbi:MAG: hypothetical protein LBF89_06240 [Bacteroidales bacterium]|nr:hypothetical protein [Bacteroidales bacterium]